MKLIKKVMLNLQKYKSDVTLYEMDCTHYTLIST